MAYVTDTQLAADNGSTLVEHIADGAGATARTVQGKLRDVVHVDDFGAVGDGMADDSGAFTDALSALQSQGGGTLRIGRKTYAIASPIILDAPHPMSLVIEGEGAGSIIRQTTANASVVEIGATQIQRASAFRRLALTNAGTGGHIISVGRKGCTLFEMDHVDIAQSNPAKHVIHAPHGEVYDSRFHGGDWYLHPGSTVSGVHIRTDPVKGPSFNENIFENLRVHQAYAAPFFDIASAASDSWLVNNTFRHINFEKCRGGGIKFANARGWTIENLSFWDQDSGPYAGHLIHAAGNGGYASVANSFKAILRHGDSLAPGKRDIFLEDADFSFVANCFTQHADGPSYDWNNKNVVVIGLLYGELNVGGRTSLRGDQLINYGSIFGGSVYGDALLSVGGINVPEQCRISSGGGYVNFDAMANGLGQIFAARAPDGTITKLVFAADGQSFWPLTDAKVDLGFAGQSFRDAYLSGTLKVDSVQVVSSQQPPITDAKGGDEVPKINAILAALRAHGLIAAA
ncbi:glycosyl hydrolase family 28-related protein [Sphingosinicella sp. LHD-64]|uniref:glycosyl hydrolase family 28-related protein n=1 Tax=Sphingosinicella sp. LHD-64 TaxID=3072139 RepID=UPI00280E4118|nr:glycosyl hydrolase family 28-related protein [Sphingosinicella sp. LHD-64]MDQ8757943.1 glycosyl hydrolase family 28-related protein [Sphingosinicella sp. LHD-64]